MNIKIVSNNRKAFHSYFVETTFEAGMVLTGSEVKSIRDGAIQLKDSYVTFLNNELWLANAHISPYKSSSYNNHEPERKRKLLLHKHEIQKIIMALKTAGLTMVPLKVYFKKGKAKVELALVKGKKSFDKRESIKKRDEMRRVDQARKSRGPR